MEKTVTLKNGFTYRFYTPVWSDVICGEFLFDGKWNRLSVQFHSEDELNAWIDEINAKYDSISKEPIKKNETHDDFNPYSRNSGNYCGD